MKRYIPLLALLLVSQLYPQAKVNINNLVEYGDKMYKTDDDRPYTGKVFDLYKSNGNKKVEGYYKDGLRNRKWAWWSEDGKMDSLGTYENGSKNGKWTYWHENGQKKFEGPYKDGKENGWFRSWYGDGQIKGSGQYSDGKYAWYWFSWDSLGIEASADDWLHRGSDAMNTKNKEYDEAILYYEKAIELKPDYGFKECWEKAIELDPDDGSAYNSLGYVYYKQGNHTKAIELIEKAIELDPDYVNYSVLGGVYESLGDAYYEQGNYTKAIQSYEKTIDFEVYFKFKSYDYVKLGLAYKAQGNTTKAIQSYEKAIELDPDNVGAYYNLGNAYADQGSYETSQLYYKEAVDAGIRVDDKEIQDKLKIIGDE